MHNNEVERRGCYHSISFPLKRKSRTVQAILPILFVSSFLGLFWKKRGEREQGKGFKRRNLPHPPQISTNNSKLSA